MSQAVASRHHISRMSKNHPEYCHSATTVGIRLANQSAVLVTGSGAKGTLRSGGVTLRHVTWAGTRLIALGTAEVTGQSLHSHCLLIRFAARAWVAVVGGVGCNRHLQLHQSCTFVAKIKSIQKQYSPSEFLYPLMLRKCQSGRICIIQACTGHTKPHCCSAMHRRTRYDRMARS